MRRQKGGTVALCQGVVTISLSATLLLVWLGLSPSPAQAQRQQVTASAGLNPDAPEVRRDCLALENTLKQSKMEQELRALPMMSRNQVFTRFLKFRPHAKDASWVSPEPADEIAPSGAANLPTNTKVFFQNVLSPVGGIVPGHNVRASFMSLMAQDQAWTALDILENDLFYFSTERLATAMMERERDPQALDLLALVAARAMWMRQGRSSQQYQQLIDWASRSSQKSVADSARLWREAVGSPQSADGLLLANQIWTTLWVDLDSIHNGAALAQRISTCGQAVYEREMKSQKDSEAKEQQLGRLAAVISRAAYQTENPVQMKWAVDTVSKLAHAQAEDKLYPQYNYAMQLYSRGDYSNASSEFGKVFFSGVPCDTASAAGCYMAQCNAFNNDVVGALATLEVNAKLYGEQKRVMRMTKSLRDDYRRQLGEDKAREVSLYIDKHYRKQQERALVQKALLTSGSKLAMK